MGRERRVSIASLPARVGSCVVACSTLAIGLAPWGRAEAQLASRPLPAAGYANSVGFGPSYGRQLDRDAWFWGLSLDYGRRLGDRWAGNAALTWDREHKETGAVVETYSLVATVSRVITRRFSLATGLAKGFADDDNSERRMRFANADLGTGLSLGISLPELRFWAREVVALSVTYEYNFSAAETSVSADLTAGVSF